MDRSRFQTTHPGSIYTNEFASAKDVSGSGL